MKHAWAGSCLALVGLCAHAETQYVTDQLVVGIYAAADLAGERLAVIRTADSVEVLSLEGESALVRLEDGTEGWVKASYLEAEPPRSARVEALEAENRKLRAGAAGPASEIAALQKTNVQLRADLESAREEVRGLQRAQAPPPQRSEDEVPIETVRPAENHGLLIGALVILLLAACLGGGFAWGYYTLERRIRRKYGGLKVY